MTNTIKVICIERCNSHSYSDPEWIIYDRGEMYDFYDDGYCPEGEIVKTYAYVENYSMDEELKERASKYKTKEEEAYQGPD